MIKLDNVGQQAVYFTSPYFSNIDLTGAYVKAVKWDKSGNEGVMIVDKNNTYFKIGLFPKLYHGQGDLERKTLHDVHGTARKITANLTRVGTPHFKLGFIYNLKQLS
ncbi:hypothetical protein [Acetilactobacillus jinshanensis]|uniref:Uncharacterized protein n=1 Tax=Acetilactobacillus jinshanensis TaxID=1720083 RepID=A0A4P6ZL20_9LACO|nr:hypothetical protein [Acetilactobacillus jinshanensis]QBP18348.1 hypothetical protein ELX58_04180 [Acetilactobacillus jinshanensis]URL61214.1 hypothetical protein HGK75_04250 [uncultured bacterium]